MPQVQFYGGSIGNLYQQPPAPGPAEKQHAVIGVVVESSRGHVWYRCYYWGHRGPAQAELKGNLPVAVSGKYFAI